MTKHDQEFETFPKKSWNSDFLFIKLCIWLLFSKTGYWYSLRSIVSALRPYKRPVSLDLQKAVHVLQSRAGRNTMKFHWEVIFVVFLLWRWVRQFDLWDCWVSASCISCSENPKRFSSIRIFLKNSLKDFFLQGPIKAQEEHSLSGFCEIRLSLIKTNRNGFFCIAKRGMCLSRSANLRAKLSTRRHLALSFLGEILKVAFQASWLKTASQTTKYRDDWLSP